MAVAFQAVMDDRIMVSWPVKIPVGNFTMVPTKCPDMFQVDWKHAHALNLEINFQLYIWNLYRMTTPMEMARCHPIYEHKSSL